MFFVSAEMYSITTGTERSKKLEIRALASALLPGTFQMYNVISKQTHVNKLSFIRRMEVTTHE